MCGVSASAEVVSVGISKNRESVLPSCGRVVNQHVVSFHIT